MDFSTPDIATVIMNHWNVDIIKNGVMTVVTSGHTYFVIICFHSAIYGSVLTMTYSSETDNYAGIQYGVKYNGGWHWKTIYQ